MVVGEEDVLEFGLPLLDDLLVDVDIEDGVDDDALLLGLDVVREDGKVGSLILGQVEPLPSLFSHNLVHLTSNIIWIPDGLVYIPPS